jgi:hypothetical protein
MWWKHCIFPHKTLWIATNHFVQSLSFLSSTQLFFPSWNIGFIILLVSISYLVLIHNYNNIKYICFISPRQRAGMPSRILYKRPNSQPTWVPKFQYKNWISNLSSLQLAFIIFLYLFLNLKPSKCYKILNHDGTKLHWKSNRGSIKLNLFT